MDSSVVTVIPSCLLQEAKPIALLLVEAGGSTSALAGLQIDHGGRQNHHCGPGPGAEGRLQVDHQRAGLLGKGPGASAAEFGLARLEPQAALVPDRLVRTLELFHLPRR